MLKRTGSMLRRQPIAILALVVALGGTSYAAVKLPRNSVGTKQIKNRAVTKAKLAPPVKRALDADRTGPTGPADAKGETGGRARQARRAWPASPDRRVRSARADRLSTTPNWCSHPIRS